MTAQTNFLIERIRCQALVSKRIPDFKSQKILFFGYLKARLDLELITEQELQQEIGETDRVAEVFDLY